MCIKISRLVLAISLLFVCATSLNSCNSKTAKQDVIFRLLEPGETNVAFSNNITETDSLNILDYLYFYNGAGLASADFNNDGLDDLYFISNQESNKLYLNQGDMKFEDITIKAGVSGSGNWKTGVTIVDINNDGFKDIYVSVVSGYKSLKGKNQLFINNGNLTFTEKAADYDLDFAGLSTQASFLDYDKDGDLDMFLLTHSVHSNDTYGDSTLRFKYNEVAGDHLFRNDNNKFTDVTKSSGIYAASIGYGLGISVSDFNNDGWDDIYVGNDFFEQDYYYINQQNGTFKEKLKEAFGHTSLFSMGTAAGDINLDGNLDIVSTDMLPADIKMLKTTINDEPLDIYNLEVKAGFYYQNSRNSLQLNVANGKKFVDIGLYSGVSATDWTWSPLIQDFDMDGHKDLFFSNGIKKRLNDLDYLKYLGDPNVVDDFDKNRKFDRSKVEKMPDGRVPNVLYRGDSALKFTNVSDINDMNKPSASAGAVYVDLDNDGDLDIATNNMDEPAFIYQNNRIQSNTVDKPAFVTLSVKYKGANIDGIGTKLFMRSVAGKVDHQEIQTSTAFQSSQNTSLLFTFSAEDKPLDLLLVWPDNSYQIVSQFRLANKQKIIYNSSAVSLAGKQVDKIIADFIKGSSQFQYQNMNADLIAELKVSQTPDFNYYSLLPHTYLKHAPPIAVADINNDGLDDLYIGGIAGEEKYLLVGSLTGKYEKIAVAAFSKFPDVSDAEALWVDLDNDKDLDLVVTNAEHPLIDFPEIRPNRVFVNMGGFKFEAKELPAIHSPVSKMVSIDYNSDGLKDLFFAGAVYFKNYTKNLPSFLFLNRGKGNFEVTSPNQFPELAAIPYIRDLAVADLNADGKDDLVISAEWQPLKIFLSKGKMLEKKDLPLIDEISGWWQSVTIADLDQDGKADVLAGNWGLNNKYNVAEDQPLYAYNNDLDDDGKADLILSYFYNGNHYPFRPKNDLEQELPYLKKEWLSYQKMADKTTSEIFKGRLNEKERLEANSFQSIFISDISDRQEIRNLPFLYQQAPIMSATLAEKPNKLVVNGNFWGVIPFEGKYDALGLATLEYNKEKKQFLQPKYWVNSLFNFNEISFMSKLKGSNKLTWIILTSEGKLLSVSEKDLKPVLANK